MISSAAMMRKLVTLFLLTTPLFGEWHSDWEAAKKLAAETQKDLYLVFTSIDSSGACQQLEKRILSSEKFQKAAEEKFVLVRLDLPTQKRLQRDGFEAKKMVAQKFGVGGMFPVSFYLDQNGKPYHRELGVLPGGPEDYAMHLAKKQEKRVVRDQGFVASEKLQGLEKAKALVEVLESLPDETVLHFYPEKLTDLAKLDPDDQLGFRKEKVTGHAYAKLEESIKGVFHRDSYDQVVELVDSFLEHHQPEGELRQKALFRKLAAQNHGANFESAMATANEIIEIDATSSHGRFAAQIKAKLQKRLSEKN